MTGLIPDPLESGIANFARRFRNGDVRAADVVAAYLSRIADLEPALACFEYVAGQALEQARALDALLASGVDLGPLMGVPVVFKDLIQVDGMPTTAGSNLAVPDMIGTEGTFVRRLKRAGCVMLGKVKTVEFARGASGINTARGTPRNPWDARRRRAPGGSSSGSGVAMAAGLTGFAVGTDTGGSVRNPAAFCGVFGMKTTHGLWPTDGMCPMSPSLDTIGLLTRSAADAAAVFAGIEEIATPAALPIRGLRLGRPTYHFFDGLDPAVSSRCEAVLDQLARAGADIVPIEFPEVVERLEFLRDFTTPEFLAVLGRDRLLAARNVLTPMTVERTLPALDVKADAYIRMIWRMRELKSVIADRMRGLDAWLAPTIGMLPPTLDEIEDVEQGLALEARLGLNTHNVSIWGLCAASIPVQAPGFLPIGLQVVCAGGADIGLLAISRAIEEEIGFPPRPDLRPFLAAAKSLDAPERNDDEGE